jgi:hypothetical protein
VIEHYVVHDDPERYFGWPANYGLWTWGEEAVCIFLQCERGGSTVDLHARDRKQPVRPMQARSLDGGRTWSVMPFPGVTPGGLGLSGDEHVDGALKAAPNIVPTRDLPVLDTPIDFLDRETLVMGARTDLAAGSLSWFYVSRDRARSWQGPYHLGDLGLSGLSARTDIVPLGRHDALWLISAAKEDGSEGRVVCARTRDGGRSFTLESIVDDQPGWMSIMPASLKLASGRVLALVRCQTPKGAIRAGWIDQFVSDDEGKTWQPAGRPVPDVGPAGNPPALVRLADGRLVVVYGYRSAPFGIRARMSANDGVTWGPEVVLRDDGGGPDLGYPRLVVRDDGRLLAVYYYNLGDASERFIAATVFDADMLPSA